MSKKNKKPKYYYYGEKTTDQGSIALIRSNIKHTYRNKFYNIWMNRYKWTGLSERLGSQEQWFIMNSLWSKGHIAASQPTFLQDLVYTDYASSGVNLYGFTNTVTLVNQYGAPSSVVKPGVLTVGRDVAIGYAQPNHKSILSIVDMYIDKIAEIEMVINTNLQTMKMPFLIGVTEEDRERLQDLINRLLNDETVIFADLEDLQKVQVLATNTPFVIDKLAAYKVNLENELLTFLGIDNTGGIQKKERLIVDEVNASNQMINEYGNAITDTIRQWLADIKRIFNVTITIEPQSMPVMSIQEEGGKKDVDTDSK